MDTEKLLKEKLVIEEESNMQEPTQQELIDYAISNHWYYNRDIENLTNRLQEIENILNLWHEKNMSYQVCITESQMIFLLKDYPEFWIYRKEHNIITYIEDSLIYMYVNWFEEWHKQILEAYNAVIKTKN